MVEATRLLMILCAQAIVLRARRHAVMQMGEIQISPGQFVAGVDIGWECLRMGLLQAQCHLGRRNGGRHLAHCGKAFGEPTMGSCILRSTLRMVVEILVSTLLPRERRLRIACFGHELREFFKDALHRRVFP